MPTMKGRESTCQPAKVYFGYGNRHVTGSSYAPSFSRAEVKVCCAGVARPRQRASGLPSIISWPWQAMRQYHSHKSICSYDTESGCRTLDDPSRVRFLIFILCNNRPSSSAASCSIQALLEHAKLGSRPPEHFDYSSRTFPIWR